MVEVVVMCLVAMVGVDIGNGNSGGPGGNGRGDSGNGSSGGPGGICRGEIGNGNSGGPGGNYRDESGNSDKRLIPLVHMFSSMML